MTTTTITIISKILVKLKYQASVRNLSIALLLIAISSFACQSNDETSVNVNNVSPSPIATEKKTDDFQDSLTSVRTGNFAFILAFRRLDGEVFSGDDKKFVKANAPADTNQWVLTADGKCVIAGSNYKFMPENLDALRKRFSIEDYSPKPIDDGNSNVTIGSSSNTSTNSNSGSHVNSKSNSTGNVNTKTNQNSGSAK